MIRKLSWFDDQNFINKYYIDDVVDYNTETLFILESPSQKEILCNAPASGRTGRKITNKLLCEDCKRGIGELRKHNLVSHNNIANKIGIMNISQIPMQLIDYSIEDLNKIDKCKLTNLSWLRKRIQSSGEITYIYKNCSIKKIILLMIFYLRFAIGCILISISIPKYLKFICQEILLKLFLKTVVITNRYPCFLKLSI
mgnify:CR=1 FL=1